MGKPKFTPDPWYLRGGDGFPLFVEAKPVKSKMPYGLDVCGEDYTGYGDEEQREYNMHLIVKSPAMYKMLEDLVKLLPSLGAGKATILRIEKLLAEARGEKEK